MMSTSRPVPLKMRVRQVDGAPIVAIRAWVRGGARVESVPGCALVTGRALVEGSERRDWRQIAEETEARGAVVGSSASLEAHGVAVDALAEDWERAIDWAAELLLEPAFPPARVAFLQRQAAAELESLGDRPEVRTSWVFMDQLYRPHPRSRPIHGSAESLASLDADQCRAFHQQALGLDGSGITVSVAGVVDPAAVTARLIQNFTVPANDAKPRSEPAAPNGEAERRCIVELPPGDQAHLFAGRLTVPLDHPDRYALNLLAVVLGAGAGLTGRLPERIREQEGLAYSVQVSALSGAGLDPGRLAIYVGTSPKTVAQAEKAVLDELRRLVEDGLSDEEIEEARSYLLGRDPFHHETARQWASLMGQAELYGSPEDDPTAFQFALAALDRDTLMDVARRHLGPDDLTLTIGLPSS